MPAMLPISGYSGIAARFAPVGASQLALPAGRVIGVAEAPCWSSLDRPDASAAPRRRRTSRRRPRGSRGSGETKAAQAALSSQCTSGRMVMSPEPAKVVGALRLSAKNAVAAPPPRCGSWGTEASSSTADDDTETPTGGSASPLSSRSTGTSPSNALHPMQVEPSFVLPPFASWSTPTLPKPPPGLQLPLYGEAAHEPMSIRLFEKTLVRLDAPADVTGVDWPSGTTTVMLRNIPNRYTPEELLKDMDGRGFDGAIDFFYLPTDFNTKKNKGYAFVNLRCSASAERFRIAFDGRRLTQYVSQKVLEHSPAVTQGFDANVKKYLKHQAGRVQNPWFKPMIFVPPMRDTEAVCSRWRRLPLSEENLREHARTMALVAAVLGSGVGLDTPSEAVAAAVARLRAGRSEDAEDDTECDLEHGSPSVSEADHELDDAGLVRVAAMHPCEDPTAQQPRAHRRRGPHRAGRRRRGSADEVDASVSADATA